MEMETKLIAFLILSSVILFGWWYVQSKLFQKPADSVNVNGSPVSMVSPTPGQTSIPAPTNRVDNIHTATPATPAEARQIKIKTDHWTATMSNRGAVITEWTMTSLPNGKPIDPPNGVNLISASLSQSVGAALRFSIPADPVQKKVNYIMPIIFILIMKSAPAGLVLYWMVSTLVGVAQQFVINRLIPAPCNLQPR
jgi:YidC/Oxa1 family membrane protein insertase